MPLPCAYAFELFAEEIRKYAANQERIFLLIDLTDASRPDAAARIGLQQLFSTVGNVAYAAAFSGRNILLNSAARFVLQRFGLPSFSIHKHEEEAVHAILQARDAG